MLNRINSLLAVAVIISTATGSALWGTSSLSARAQQSARRAPIVVLDKKRVAIYSLGATGVPVRVTMAGRPYKGTYLTTVRDAGLGRKSGLRVGDILIRINNRVPFDPKSTDSIINGLTGKSGVPVHFIRKTSKGLRFGQKVMGWSKEAVVKQKPDSLVAKKKFRGSINTSSLVGYMYRLVNEDRKKNGLEALRVSGKLESISRGHSQDMARRGYTGHYDPEGKGFRERADAAGVRAGVSENVGKMLIEPKMTDAQLIAKCQDLLMHSSRHRFNLLQAKNKSMGIGMAQHSDGSIAVTQMFSDSPNP